MIDKQTLAAYAKLSNLRPWQQEKHYVQAILLTALSEQSLVFKGGTYLWFFQGLNRFSEDLDFTAVGELAQGIDSKASESLKLFGVENSIKQISDDDRSFSFRISAKGPLYSSPLDQCFVYVEVSKREKILKPTQSVKLDFPAYNLPTKLIAGMDLSEVAAEKVRAILSREKARDIFDLFFLIKNKNAAFDKALVEEKLSYYKQEFSAKTLEENLLKREKNFVKELKPLVFGELPDYALVKKTVLAWAASH